MRTIQQQLEEKGLSDGPERVEEKSNTKDAQQTQRAADTMGIGRTNGQ